MTMGHEPTSPKEPEPTWAAAKPVAVGVQRRQLFLLMVHGTWSTGKDWTQSGTPFYDDATFMLNKLGFEVTQKRFQWSGKNRWNYREESKERLKDEVAALLRESPRSEVLVVAHSHGGNIATESAREWLNKHPDFPVIGVVCMNTPFLKQEPRAAANYLQFWFFISLIFLSLPYIGSRLTPHWTPEAVQLPGFLWPLNRIEVVMIDWALLAICAVLVMMLFLSREVAKRMTERNGWRQEPDVLCLSCADDEAITALGLVEGLANLGQLLLHPLMLLLYFVSAIVLTGISQTSLHLDNFPAILSSVFDHVRALFVTWTLLAIIIGCIASLVVMALFGLGSSRAVQSMVSRVLVSYVPLRPARAHFRVINELNVQWWKPWRLLHSSIYDSKQTIDEIEEWLRNVHPGVLARSGLPFERPNGQGGSADPAVSHEPVP